MSGDVLWWDDIQFTTEPTDDPEWTRVTLTGYCGPRLPDTATLLGSFCRAAQFQISGGFLSIGPSE